MKRRGMKGSKPHVGHVKTWFKHSLTILWARVIALAGLLLAAGQSLLADPNVTGAIQSALQPNSFRTTSSPSASSPRSRAGARRGVAMFATVLGWLGNLIGGPFAKAAVDAYRAKLTAENTSREDCRRSGGARTRRSNSASANWRRRS